MFPDASWITCSIEAMISTSSNIEMDDSLPSSGKETSTEEIPSLRSSQSSIASSHLPGGQSLFLFEAVVLQVKCRTHHSEVLLRLLLVNKCLVQRFIGAVPSADSSAY